VKAAVKETKKEKASPSPSKKAKSSPKTSGSSSDDDDDDKASEDVADSCAYQPSVAATAQPAR
jgi:hypothetical protein